MATKQIRKTKPKPAQTSKTKTKTKAKPEPDGRKPAEAPDTKIKTTAREPAEATATKAKGTRRKVVPAVETKASRRRPARTLGGEGRKPESNGHVAKHAESPVPSRPGDDQGTAAATTSGPQQKAARSQHAERIFLSLFETLDAHAKSQGIGHVAQDAQFDWGETGNQELHFPTWPSSRSIAGRPTGTCPRA